MADQLHFEDVEIGDAAPVIEHTLNRTDLVRYAGASGDYNPMHHDETKAQAAGLPSVFGHDMFSMGLLGRAVTDHVGLAALQRFAVRFTKQTWPGNVLTTSVVVKDKRKDGDDHLVDFDVALVNQDGDPVVTGEVTAVLPTRG